MWVDGSHSIKDFHRNWTRAVTSLCTPWIDRSLTATPCLFIIHKILESSRNNIHHKINTADTSKDYLTFIKILQQVIEIYLFNKNTIILADVSFPLKNSLLGLSVETKLIVSLASFKSAGTKEKMNMKQRGWLLH